MCPVVNFMGEGVTYVFHQYLLLYSVKELITGILPKLLFIGLTTLYKLTC
jgi:hypothetical protein